MEKKRLKIEKLLKQPVSVTVNVNGNVYCAQIKLEKDAVSCVKALFPTGPPLLKLSFLVMFDKASQFKLFLTISAIHETVGCYRTPDLGIFRIR